jgi:hypothetical protein
LGEYDVPDEVLSLLVDIERMDSALAALRTVSEHNITSNATSDDREFARRMKWITIRQIETWQRFSQLKLRECLAK